MDEARNAAERDDQGALSGNTGRALIVFGSHRKAESGVRPQADFLAQLIACRQRLGAYRDRRRSEPKEAASRYVRERISGAPEFDVVV